MKRFFVHNKTSSTIVEKKPRVGEFILQPGETVEFPEAIAKSLVLDFAGDGLELIEEEVKPPPVFEESGVITSGKRKKNK